jgi:hypothetical protein
MSTTLQVLSDSQVSKEVPINENTETLSAAGIFGKRHPATTALTWGYYGGRYNGNTVANGTVSLTDSATNYVVVHRSTGVVSVSTSTTNWSDTSTYARLYQLTTSGGAVTATVDARMDTGGLLNGGGGSLGPIDAADVIVANSFYGSPHDLESALAVIEDLLQYITSSAFQTGGGGAEPEAICIACSDETTALTTGTAKATFRMPFAMTLTSVRASLTTAQASGSTFTVDINEAGSTILSTKITIDNTEKTSTTAAAAPVISDSSLADDAEITIDIDQVGNGSATGLKVYLIGTRT